MSRDTQSRENRSRERQRRARERRRERRLARRSRQEEPLPRRKRPVGQATSARTIFWRTVILMGIFGIAAFIPLAWQLYNLQVVQYEELSANATTQQTQDVTTTVTRGNIYATDGKTLAVSTTVYNIILSPKDINTVSDDDLKIVYGDDYEENMTTAQIEAAKNSIAQTRIDFIATNLSSMIDGVEYDDVAQRCQSLTSMYSVVAKRVDADVADNIKSFISRYEALNPEYNLEDGIYMTTDAKRYYPYGSLGCHVVGFVNVDNDGVYGVEKYYDDILSGEEGRTVAAKTRGGTSLLYYYADEYGGTEGYDIYLTLDTTIQSYCEQTLAAGIERYNVLSGGWCIAMNPNTGAIYGMASYPTYDLNNPADILDETRSTELQAVLDSLNQQVESGEITQEEADADYETEWAAMRDEQWTNRAINTTYEPGSTFKSIVLAAALEEGTVNTDSTFECTGSVLLDTWTIRCSNTFGHGEMSLVEAVGQSCNMAFVQIGSSLGGRKFWSYLEAFGITSNTGIDLPTESYPLIWTESEFISGSGYVNRAVASFGQRFTLTPIAMITAVAATINGGYLHTPHVMQEIVDSDGVTIATENTDPVRQVISESTSEIVCECLEHVVSTNETGENAYQAGYRIGGKTGTAQTTTSDYRFIVSFVGFAPADDPQIIVLLSLDEPETREDDHNFGTSGLYISGGNMACPLAGELIAEICDYLGVAKQYSGSEASSADATMPSLIGKTLSEAEDALSGQNLYYDVTGDATGTVTAQVPSSGTVLGASSTVHLYFGTTPDTETVAMPDLSGMTTYDARSTLESYGLYYRGTGMTNKWGVVCDGQSLAAGTEVSKGTVITAHFSTQTTTSELGG